MSLDPTWLFLSLIPSGAGFVLLVYGRKEGRWPHVIVGLALMVYPYFATSVASLITIGAILTLALWLAVKRGW
jgi:hypothetical protein